MQIRQAGATDVQILAQIHVAAWEETYTGLLPESEIAAHTVASRRAQWADQIARAQSRVWIAGEVGFAQVGPQRDPTLKATYPRELYALYLLRAGQGQGLGRALVRAALAPAYGPFTAVVLTNNARACTFYTRLGGRVIGRDVAEDGFEDLIFGWSGQPRL